MTKSTELTIRLDGPLNGYVSSNVGDGRPYKTAEEFICELIRRDKARVEADLLEHLKAELTHTFDASKKTDDPRNTER